MKTRALIDLQPSDPRGFLDALKQRDFGWVARQGTVYLISDTGGPAEFPLSSAEAGFDDCIVSLPLAVLDFRILHLPFSDPEKLRKVIPYELDNLILGGSQGVVFDVVTLKISESSSEVLVAYLQKEVLSDLLQTLSPRGIDPRVVTAVDLRAALDEPSESIASLLAGTAPPQGGQRLRTVQAELAAPTVNLRSGPFAFRKDVDTLWRTLRVTALLACVLVVFVHTVIGAGSIAARTESDRVRTAIRKDYATLFPQERKVTDELYQLRAHVKVLRDKQGTLLTASPLQTLKTISENRIQGVFLTEFALDRDSVTVRGEAPSVNDVDLLKAKLSPRFPDLRVSDIKPGADGRMIFTMSARTGAP